MRLCTVLFLLLSLASLTSGQVIDTSEEAVRKDVLFGYGFCQGQKYAFETVKSRYPDLRLFALQIEYKFDATFGKACDFFEGLLPEQTKQLVLEQAQKELDPTQFTPMFARAFLELAQKRAGGQLESPYIETLLTWHPDFKDAPDLEFSRSFTKKFSSKNHQKAKGLHLELSVPRSWKAREGNRPNIVQFFRAKNGFSNVSFSLMVKEATSPGEKHLTQREINDMFSAQGIREFGQVEAASNAGSLVESKPIVLEGLKGGLLVIDANIERLDQKLSIRMAQYVLYYNNRFIYLQFSYSGDPAKRTEWLREFDKNRALFGMIANSLVISDIYKN